ncbi:unnamed protein product [Euphydryas editha]|nr:unnamed protein product [Euphydryas editha]
MARMGVIDIGTSQWNDKTDMRITEIIKHPDYRRSKKYHDLALLRLERSIEINQNLSPICLYTEEEDPSIPLTVSGWGTTSATRDEKSQILLKANLSVVPISRCKDSYKNWLKLPKEITDEQICAGDSKGLHDACQGDSGGPLQGLPYRDGFYRLVGITSFGRGCGSAEPGVYIRIAKYLDWIEDVVWPNEI